jgi:hypothetical protein
VVESEYFETVPGTTQVPPTAYACICMYEVSDFREVDDSGPSMSLLPENCAPACEDNVPGTECCLPYLGSLDDACGSNNTVNNLDGDGRASYPCYIDWRCFGKD